jgi:hypothetical protein
MRDPKSLNERLGFNYNIYVDPGEQLPSNLKNRISSWFQNTLNQEVREMIRAGDVTVEIDGFAANKDLTDDENKALSGKRANYAADVLKEIAGSVVTTEINANGSKDGVDLIIVHVSSN